MRSPNCGQSSTAIRPHARRAGATALLPRMRRMHGANRPMGGGRSGGAWRSVGEVRRAAECPICGVFPRCPICGPLPFPAYSILTGPSGARRTSR